MYGNSSFGTIGFTVNENSLRNIAFTALNDVYKNFTGLNKSSNNKSSLCSS